MTIKFAKAAFAALFLVGFLIITPAASASVVGHMDLTNCAGGGVSVTATTIDWIPPAGPPNGCVVSGIATNLVFSGGSVGSGVTGSILDLNAAAGLPVANFITFSGSPSLHFDLTNLGPGASNTACTSSFDPNSAACSVFAGSPFLLKSGGTGTSVTLSASGTVSDGTSPVSNWIGAFTTQIAGVTPAQIQSTILGGGSVSSTYSGDFTLTVVPEPASLSSMALGGLLIAGGIWRRKRNK